MRTIGVIMTKLSYDSTESMSNVLLDAIQTYELICHKRPKCINLPRWAINKLMIEMNITNSDIDMNDLTYNDIPIVCINKCE
jgi:hypothetical protein